MLYIMYINMCILYIILCIIHIYIIYYDYRGWTLSVIQQERPRGKCFSNTHRVPNGVWIDCPNPMVCSRNASGDQSWSLRDEPLEVAVCPCGAAAGPRGSPMDVPGKIPVCVGGGGKFSSRDCAFLKENQVTKCHPPGREFATYQTWSYCDPAFLPVGHRTPKSRVECLGSGPMDERSEENVKKMWKKCEWKKCEKNVKAKMWKKNVNEKKMSKLKLKPNLGISSEVKKKPAKRCKFEGREKYKIGIKTFENMKKNKKCKSTFTSKILFFWIWTKCPWKKALFANQWDVICLLRMCKSKIWTPAE